MDNYFIFVSIAAITILSPGPGVLLKLSNSIRFGFKGAISGIVGVALGTFVVAAISATSLGIILALSTIAFTTMKYIGAAYLIYLGIKLWRSNSHNLETKSAFHANMNRRFFEGVLIQVTNPKAVFFFMSIFPQFIDYSANFVTQFSTLVITYSILVVIIHMAYALIAASSRNWVSTPRCSNVFNKIGGGIFICFGVGLATSNK